MNDQVQAFQLRASARYQVGSTGAETKVDNGKGVETWSTAGILEV